MASLPASPCDASRSARCEFLSSIFNSTAALFTVDVYEKLRPGASEARLVTVGRLATLVVVVLDLAWIPVMPLISKGGLYQYLQSVQATLHRPSRPCSCWDCSTAESIIAVLSGVWA
ncbi:MAG: hypothetical protein WD448_00545 [Woeseia sp.]